MAKRVNTIDRIGVNEFEKVVLKGLRWIFREQPIVDVGIDAIIERVINNNPTGELMAVQIKSGLGNVNVNKNGDFDYYISRVHYQYWSSYPIPVIIALYDDATDIIYWNSVSKRNMPKTKDDKHKITIKKDSILSSSSITELEDIIRLYQSKHIVDDDDFDPADGDELLNYCSNILSYSSDSISKTRRFIEDLDKVYKEQEAIMQKFIDEHPGNADKSIVEKVLKQVTSNYTIGYNVFNTRMSNELPILVETHVKALLYTNNYIFPQLAHPGFADIANELIFELKSESESIATLKETVCQLSQSFKSDKNTISINFVRAKNNCANILDDYVCELNDLVDLIEKCIITISKTAQN